MARPVIAVVHDDTEFASQLAATLASAGYQALLLRRDGQPHEVIRQQKPALVVVDILDTQLDTNWKLIQLLWLDRTTARTPLVLCLPLAQPATATESRLARTGCALIHKPLTMDAVLAAIASQLAIRSDQPAAGHQPDGAAP
jgi:ActR/RegA family two-component response regulator